MQILDADQIRAWDQYTIFNEPVASIDLMERASLACSQWLESHLPLQENFKVFCGKGNNGGDGLAIARLQIEKGKNVIVYILEFGNPGSDDFQVNLQRLHLVTDKIYFIQSAEHFPLISTGEVVIDALMGSGLNKPLSGLYSLLVEHLNHSSTTIVSIDIPSGMFLDRSSLGLPVVHASYTLSFQCWKTCLLASENEDLLGDVHILPIGLDIEYLKKINPLRSLITLSLIRDIYKKRKRFAHKGKYGHCLMAGGSLGKMGAMVLATKACVRSGAGLTTCFIPRTGMTIMQTSIPEAMAIAGEQEYILSGLPADIEKFSCIGVGPGMGTENDSLNMMSFFVRRFTKPMVIDADGLNCLAKDPGLMKQLPSFSVLTPHPKEFDRLFGDHPDEFQRWNTAVKKASEFNLVIVLKGHHTLVALPTGEAYYNTTGNPGMAKGGSGDVLTGIITSLVAQNYLPGQAAILGVYLHGLAADLAVKEFSEESLMASDIIEFLPSAFKLI